MKTSYDEESFEDCQSLTSDVVSPVIQRVEILSAERWSETASQNSLLGQIEDSSWISQIYDNSYAPTEVSSLTGQEEFSSMTALTEEVTFQVQTDDDLTALNEEIISLQGYAEDVMSLREEVVTSDTEAVVVQDTVSEMYYTASSEVSLLSDEMADRPEEEKEKKCVIAGHVAAMRERFESMTRTNTPCPDTMRSTSPLLDVIRNITPSPDHLG